MPFTTWRLTNRLLSADPRSVARGNAVGGNVPRALDSGLPAANADGRLQFLIVAGKTLGIEIPPSILLRADRVVK